MKLIRIVLVAFLFLFAMSTAPDAPAQSKPATPRSAVETFFALLKSRKYDALYDSLPSQFQQQITREQLAQSMNRLNGFLAIERLEIGRVQQRGEYAVVDTTIYGRLKQPLKLGTLGETEIREGRVSAQQYLFREAGAWKLATADNRSQSFFLQRNPDFNKQFQIARPKFEFKRDGNWETAGPRPQMGPQMGPLTKPKR
jgi:hypothetical protein